MPERLTLAVAALLLPTALTLLPSRAGAAPNDRDTRRLTAAEAATFLPLVCAHPRKDTAFDVHFYRCSAILGRTKQNPDIQQSIELSAILYGGFTHEGADEAYVTYYWARTENWGGGLLFARSAGAWKLSRWVGTRPWLGCTKIPETVPQRSLCWWGHGTDGASFQTIYDVRVPSAGSPEPEFPTVLAAGHGPDKAGFGCYGGVPKDRVMLTGIDALKATNAAPYFAVASVSYERGIDIANACAGRHPSKVPEMKGDVRFRMRGDKVTQVTTLPIAP